MSNFMAYWVLYDANFLVGSLRPKFPIHTSHLKDDSCGQSCDLSEVTLAVVWGEVTASLRLHRGVQ